MQTGERIFQLKRLINVRLGVDRSADDLPKRIKTALKKGGTRGHVPDVQLMVDDYYRIRGWSQNGAPSMETLRKLELDTI